MEYIGVVIVAALVFGLCFVIDKGFTKLFRSQAQHKSGLAVRLNKKYGAFGLILAALGVASFFAGSWLMIGAGCILVAVGVGLVVHYMTFGVFYDENGFVLTTFGRKSAFYRYGDIESQQLYNNYGNILIELHLAGGRSVQLQAGMTGVYSFLDKAFAAWCAQKGVNPEDCSFHDPENSCWFPSLEEM